MLPYLNFNETEILAFALILIRISAFVVSWPVFSVYSVPNHLKILFSVAIALVLFPVINRSGLSAQALNQDILALAIKEVLTGLCLGFLTRMFFFAVSIGGNLISTSLGMANAHIFNPTIGGQSTTVEQFYVTVATLLFLALNGHHFFLTGLVQSFDAIPLSLPWPGTEIASSMSTTAVNTTAAAGGWAAKLRDSGVLVQLVMEAGIKIAAPILVVSFFLNIALGIVGRAVPQINVLVTSMPVNFLVGLAIMIISIPVLVLELDHQLIAFAEVMFKFMKMN